MRKFKIVVFGNYFECTYYIWALNSGIALMNFLELYPRFEENDIAVYPQ